MPPASLPPPQFAAAIPAHLHCPFLTPQLTHRCGRQNSLPLRSLRGNRPRRQPAQHLSNALFSVSVSPVLCSAEVLGIHGADVTRAVPIFLAYLATLFHTFSLPVRLSSDPSATGAALGAATSAEAGAEEALAGDMEAGTAGQQGLPYRRRASERYLGELLGSSVSGGLQSLGLRLLQGCYAGEGVQQRLWLRAGCLHV